MESVRTIRVIVAKPGLDGHDRGAKVVARALRDAGMEVIYTGLHRTPEQIVDACIEEDAAVLLISVLSGAHRTVVPEIVSLLRSENVGHVKILAGGIIPEVDAPFLLESGVSEVMGPGTRLEYIVERVRQLADESYAARESEGRDDA
ncbi:cobalamin B12-binding domain-containing protein [bacterium]|nr:cobalamin B12-binding domain-containing protein [bacterium]